jgi:hypothetical protein
MTRPDAIAMAVNDLLHQFRATGSPSDGRSTPSIGLACDAVDL